MQPIDYATITRRTSRRNRFQLFLGAIFLVAIIAIGVLVTSTRQSGPPNPTNTLPLGLTASTAHVEGEKFNSAQVFADRIEPVLSELRKKNGEAVRRAIAKIQEHFDHARSGSPDFAESIIGPLDAAKTTYLASKGVFLRWWYKNQTIQPVRDHVKWNYEQHVTSGPKVKEAILDAIGQLEQTFRANRNEALQAIGSSLRAAHLPASVDVDQKQLDEFCQREFDTAMAKLNTGNVAEDAAVGSAAALALSTVVTFIVEKAIIYVVGEATAAAGTVATSTSGGATVGSVVPGAGTIIGAGAGLLAGGAVDIWLSHRNKVKTVDVVTKALTEIEDAIVKGNDKQPGMQKVLSDASAGQAEQLASKLKAKLAEAAR